MIEVRIPEYKLKARANETLKGHLVLTELRDALVPVVGNLVPLGVMFGQLTMSYNELGDLVLVWTE